MVSDQEIAKGVETLLRQSDPNSFSSLNGVVQQLGAKLGQDLSHKAAFIRDQINLLCNYPPQHHHAPPPPVHTPPVTFSKDHFALQNQQPVTFSKDHFALQNQQYINVSHQQLSSHFTLSHLPAYRGSPFASGPTLQPQMVPLQLQQRHPSPSPDPPTTAQPQPAKNASSRKTSKESGQTGTKRRGGTGGLNKICGISPELQAVLGVDSLTRTEVVKQIWVYIRKHGLQDPSNKRKIICNDALRAVFQIDSTDMFQMNKLLSKHIHSLEPSKESSSAKRFKVEGETSSEISSGSVAPLSPPVIISDELALFLGSTKKEMHHSEAKESVLEYVKANNLEDTNSMMVMCDPKLTELFGCESIHVKDVGDILASRHFINNS